jgi:hypothetical protein
MRGEGTVRLGEIRLMMMNHPDLRWQCCDGYSGRTTKPYAMLALEMPSQERYFFLCDNLRYRLSY